ncbi:hypothetical protein [Dehalogenimonas etheniformans]|uniref:hypothetical protein n=1 Tax=Dehalogenimonas etheniformans TaxID=1536648 RepID=UPI00139237FD|nr:hypothetical protein [Dehalogenimonas etheniformans]QNT75218.1 hypothetical protein HX448_00175 [Dehalogenimonas etheniformans]
MSLYECSNAIVQGDVIKCIAGHHLARNGEVWADRLQSGEELVFQVCQNCKDLDRAGRPVPEKERGW